MTDRSTAYGRFEASPEKRRLLRQEEFILATTIAICEAMEQQGVSRAKLAEKLGTTRGFVSQLLSGRRNLTLRSIADVADALGHRPEIQFVFGGASFVRLVDTEATRAWPQDSILAYETTWFQEPEWNPSDAEKVGAANQETLGPYEVAA